MGELVEPREATSIVLELIEKAFHEMTFFVKLFVIAPLLFTVALGWNDHFGSHFRDGRKDSFSVIGFVAEHKINFVVYQ